MSDLIKTEPTAIATNEHRPLSASGGVMVRNLTMEQHWRYCQALAKSEIGRKLGCPEEIMAITLHGDRVGMDMMQSLNSICCIGGKTTVYGKGVLALLYACPEFQRPKFKKWTTGKEPERGKFANLGAYLDAFPDDFAAHCQMARGDDEARVYTFTIAEARTAGLWKKSGPWTQYPLRMLGWKPVSWLAYDLFPDVLCGLYVHEDVIDVDYTETAGKPSKKALVEQSRHQAQEAVDAILADD
jgi:hypothetical protein